MDLTEFLIRIRPIVAHHQIGNDGCILRLNAKDIVAFDTDAVPNLDDEERNGIFLLQLTHVGDGHCWCRNGHLPSEQDGQCRRRTAHGDIADLTECVTFHIRYAVFAGRRHIRSRGVARRGIVRRRISARTAAQEGIDFLL